jgi:hypothetical protein
MLLHVLSEKVDFTNDFKLLSITGISQCVATQGLRSPSTTTGELTHCQRISFDDIVDHRNNPRH